MNRFLLFGFLVLPLLSNAQSNFQKGYLITNTKDTINGFVDYKERALNPVSFVFKQDLNGEKETYTLKNCAGFGLDDMVSYERCVVDVSLSSSDMFKAVEKIDTTIRRDTVFLQVLQKGEHITLFSYADAIKKRFYVLDKEELVPIELIRQFYRRDNNSTIVSINIQYARQLQELLRKYSKNAPAEDRKFANLRFTQPELLKAADLINGQKNIKSPNKSLRWFAGVSLDLASTKFSGVHELATPNVTSKKILSPLVNVGMDVFANSNIRKLLFRTELSFNKSRSEVSGDDGFNSFDIVSATLSSGVLYHVYNADNFKVFLNVGAAINLNKYSNQKGWTTFGWLVKLEKERILDLEPIYFSIPVNVGVVLNKRIEVIAGYSFPTSMVNYSSFSVERNKYRLGLNYLFGKH